MLALRDREHFIRNVGIAAGARADGVTIAVQYPDRTGVDRAHAALAARGVDFTAPPRRYAWGAYACYFQDPDGTVIELYGWGA